MFSTGSVDRCPRCGAPVRYHRAGERVALCGWPLAACATRMPGAFERAASECNSSHRITTKEEPCQTPQTLAFVASS